MNYSWREELLRVWQIHTEQTFGQPNCNMFLGTGSVCFWSAGHQVFSFLLTSSHMAQSLDTVTNIFHDNASMKFQHYLCGCITMRVASLECRFLTHKWVQWLYTIYLAINTTELCRHVCDICHNLCVFSSTKMLKSLIILFILSCTSWFSISKPFWTTLKGQW